MAEPRQPTLNVPRGACGAVDSAAVTAVLVVALYGAFLAGRWLLEGATEFDRALDLRAMRKELVFPILGCAAVGAGAGWAASAPWGRHRFAWSLAAVFLASLPLWIVLGWLELTPRRYKGVEHPAMYPSEALEVVGPPLVAAAILGFVRARRSGSPARGGPSAAADPAPDVSSPRLIAVRPGPGC